MREQNTSLGCEIRFSLGCEDLYGMAYIQQGLVSFYQVLTAARV
jgi:hypothetical protein